MLEERAREVGRIIGQTPEYQAVKRANDSLAGDRKALEVLKRVEQLRLEAGKSLEQGVEPLEAMETELEDLLTKIQSNPVYQQVVVSQENFDKLMYRVNAWISDGIKKGSASPIITLG